MYGSIIIIFMNYYGWRSVFVLTVSTAEVDAAMVQAALFKCGKPGYKGCSDGLSHNARLAGREAGE